MYTLGNIRLMNALADVLGGGLVIFVLVQADNRLFNTLKMVVCREGVAARTPGSSCSTAPQCGVVYCTGRISRRSTCSVLLPPLYSTEDPFYHHISRLLGVFVFRIGQDLRVSSAWLCSFLTAPEMQEFQ